MSSKAKRPTAVEPPDIEPPHPWNITVTFRDSERRSFITTAVGWSWNPQMGLTIVDDTTGAQQFWPADVVFSVTAVPQQNAPGQGE